MLWQDVRLAARLLVRDRWFTAVAVAVLALGIAANNTVFTLANGVLLRDLPFDEPDRIVALGVRNIGNARNPNSGVSYLDVLDWRASARTFEGIGAFDERTMNVSDEEHPAERFGGAFISWNTFALIGQNPVLGRDFRAEDDREGAPPVVMLGHEIWRQRYGSDPNVIGRTIRVNGTPSVVIGVMPSGLGFPLVSELWQPLALLPTETKARRDQRSLGAFGRLHDGVSIEQAVADLRGVTTSLARQFPVTNRDTEPRAEQFRSGIGQPIVALVASMMGAVGFVLLIACANVANLLLGRAAARSREVAVRISLGAGRWRIVRQLLVESLVLASVAGIAGLAFSVAAIRVFWSIASETHPPYWLQFPMDARVFGFLAAVCLGTAILFGLIPALHTSNTSVAEVLNEAGRGSAGSRRSRRWTGALIVGQFALTLVLLTGAGLIVRNLWNLSQMDPGVETAELIRMRVDLPAPAYDTPDQRLMFYRRLQERLDAVPQVRATFATAVPLAGGSPRELIVNGRSDNASERPLVTVVTVGNRYFETIGARSIRGRDFAQGDGEPGRRAVIVNERFAATHFPGEEVVGRTIRLADPSARVPGPTFDADWMTVVGVAQNIRQRPPNDGSFDPVVYVPYAVNPPFSTNILVRSDDAALAAAILREQIRAIDADVPLFDVRSVDDFLAFQRSLPNLFGLMFAVFGAIALLLALVGLYAVTAYAVSHRTREIGVRVALGAQARQIQWLVTRGAAGQLAVGLLMGAVGAFGLVRLVPRFLTGTNGADPIVLGGVAAFLVLVAMAASLIPARRATRIDPVVALRSE